MTCCRSALWDGRQGESPLVTALPEESADGTAVHKGLPPRAQGSRLPGQEGVRGGVIPLAFPCLSMGTGEPETSKVVCPVRGGTGRKGSNDLARGLPYLVP